MGSAMAHSLLRSGFAVTVWNRTAQKAQRLADDGARIASTPAEAVVGADLVVVMLFDRDAVLAVLAEAADSLSAEAVVVQSSTLGPQGMTAVNSLALQHGVQLLDAPVLGTKQPAEHGQLVVLASGDPGLRAAAQPVFDAIGSRTVWAGGQVGQASALKLACNAWVGTLTAGAAQSVALARHAGIDPQLVLDTIKGGPVDTPYLQIKGKAMIERSYPVAFTLDGAGKDVDLMLSMATDTGADTAFLLALRSMLESAARRGHGHEDMAAMYEAF